MQPDKFILIETYDQICVKFGNNSIFYALSTCLSGISMGFELHLISDLVVKLAKIKLP